MWPPAGVSHLHFSLSGKYIHLSEQTSLPPHPHPFLTNPSRWARHRETLFYGFLHYGYVTFASALCCCNSLCFSTKYFFWSSVQFGFGLTACWEVMQTHLVLLHSEMKLAGISTPHLQTFRVTPGQYYCENKVPGLKDTPSKSWAESWYSTQRKVWSDEKWRSNVDILVGYSAKMGVAERAQA